MNLPSETDFNIYNSLDEIAAMEHFFGRDLEQAELLFRENSLFYQEDLMWMGIKAFNFYLPAVTNYLKSEHAIGDDEIIHFLSDIIKFRITEENFNIALSNSIDLVEYVIKDFQKFQVYSAGIDDISIEEYTALKKELVKMN